MSDSFISARELGENIEMIRRWRGLTQEQLAAMCGVSTVSIRGYERGRSYPSIKSMTMI